MKITALIENEIGNSNQNIKAAHGLSFFIETKDSKILVDVGSNNLFLKNAIKLGIDISDVDILVISHAHIDHGNGLKYFLKNNKKATIYLHEKAREKYYTKIFNLIPIYVGLNQKTIRNNLNRISFVNEPIPIQSNIFIETNFVKKYPLPESNEKLFKQKRIKLEQDDFKHELAVIIKEENHIVIVSSCSHSGISNIANSIKNKYKEVIKAIVGGFHLYNPISKKNENIDYIRGLSKELNSLDTIYYTCHCTGKENIKILKVELQNKVKEIHVGDTINI